MTPADPINPTDRHLAITLAIILVGILVVVAFKVKWGFT